MPVITVSQLNRYIASVFRGDRNLSDIIVRGEITNISPFCRNGKTMLFFSLSDSQSLVSAVIFDNILKKLKFQPDEGMSVVISGKVTVYEQRGNYNLVVTDMIPDGAGKESIALEQLKKRLSAEGIFSQEHKRKVPAMPKKIGAVTSLRGAAVRDIINILSRRYPIGEIYAVNAQVQGEDAPESICRGILEAESAGCDVIIVGRGGGSSEDLSAFNAESVVRTVYNCKVPVISAVGHETDISLTDFAADLRAPTPSAAAELAAPDIKQLYDRIGILETRTENAVNLIIKNYNDRLNAMNIRLLGHSPEKLLELAEEKLVNLEKRNNSAVERCMERLDSTLSGKIGRLESLSPLKILARGYSLAYKGDVLVKNAAELSKGDMIDVKFDKGTAQAEIIKIEE